MENENQNKQADAKDFVELMKDVKKGSDFYKLLSVALQSYTDGLKAVSRCMIFSQDNSIK